MCLNIFFSQSLISRFRLVSNKRSTEMHASRETRKTRDTRHARLVRHSTRREHRKFNNCNNNNFFLSLYEGNLTDSVASSVLISVYKQAVHIQSKNPTILRTRDKQGRIPNRKSQHFPMITYCCDSFINEIWRDCAIILGRGGKLKTSLA